MGIGFPMFGFRVPVVVCWYLAVFVLKCGAQTDTLRTGEPVSLTARPSPRGAFLRSSILPGWGQWYNGKKRKGTVVALLEAALATGVLLQRDTAGNGLTPTGSRLLFGLFGVHVFNMADAYVDAHLADLDHPDEFSQRNRAGPAMAIGFTVWW